MTAPQPLLEITGLNTFYGGQHILRDAGFTIAAGETISLMGRNGMGKTTLLRAIMGLVPVRSGAVRLDGKQITNARTCAIARAGIALVPEGRCIFPDLDVAENLTIGMRPAADRRAAWTLARVYDLFPRLFERRRHMGNRLSGGEQQMLALGRAMLANPRLLLIDEATEGLAPLVRTRLWQTLRVIADSGVAILVVDKNIADLYALCDRHLILAKGELVFCGSSAALQSRPDLVQRWLGV